ncbi:MAG TPA: hypothetical protein VM733_07270 [Thermoanaerobaculia bacterium]|nr:hypothetical protein [Thermoanaerobaculia bacterium]
MKRAVAVFLHTFTVALCGACQADAIPPSMPAAGEKIIARVAGRDIHESDIRCPPVPEQSLPADLRSLTADERCLQLEQRSFESRARDLLLRLVARQSGTEATDAEIAAELKLRPAANDAEMSRAAEHMKAAAEAALRIKHGEKAERVYASVARNGVTRDAVENMDRTFNESQLRDFIAADQVARFHDKERERAKRTVALRKLHELLSARALASHRTYEQEEQAFWDEVLRSSGTVSLDPRFPIPSMKGALKTHASADPHLVRRDLRGVH